MIAEGTVSEIGQTQKGTPKVKIDGTWYYPNRGVQLEGLTVGSRVGVEYALFGEKQNLRGIKGWGLLPHQAGAQAPPAQGTARPLPSPTPQTTPSPVPSKGLTEGERLTISNWVAAAIQAGKVEGPADINAWVQAALHAIRGAGDPNYVPF